MNVLEGTDGLGKIKFGRVFGAVLTGGISLVVPRARGASVEEQAGQPVPQIQAAAEQGQDYTNCLLQQLGPVYYELTGKVIDQDQAAMQSFRQRLESGASCASLVAELQRQVPPRGSIGEAAKAAMKGGAIAMQQDYGKAMHLAALKLMAAGVTLEERTRIIQAGGTTLSRALEQADEVIETNRRATQLRKTLTVAGGVAAVAALGYVGYRLLR